MSFSRKVENVTCLLCCSRYVSLESASGQRFSMWNLSPSDTDLFPTIAGRPCAICCRAAGSPGLRNWESVPLLASSRGLCFLQQLSARQNKSQCKSVLLSVVFYNIAQYVALYYVVSYCIAMYCYAMHHIVLYYINFHCIALHCMALYRITIWCNVLYILGYTSWTSGPLKYRTSPPEIADDKFSA